MSYEKQFLSEISRPDEQIDIEYCALLFASRLQNLPKVSGDARELDAQVNDFLLHHPNFGDDHAFNAAYLVGVVGDVLGYRGDNVEYYSPENSLLDRVVNNRLGIPISLAAVYLAVAKRLGMVVHGISFPGHFLIRLKEPDNTFQIIDPFANKVLSDADVEKLVSSTTQSFGYFDPAWLANADTHTILVRMLENLKSVYLKLGDMEKAKQCLEFQLMIKPTENVFLKQMQAMRDRDADENSKDSPL